MPYVGPYTGATITRIPFHEEIVNVRASYADEGVSGLWIHHFGAPLSGLSDPFPRTLAPYPLRALGAWRLVVSDNFC
jgi:hypothetical protein